MRARYRSENGVVRLSQVPPTGLLAGLVIPENWGDSFIVWQATVEVFLSAGTGEMMFGLRIGGVGQPFGLDRYNLSFSTTGSRSSVGGIAQGVLRPGTTIELLGRMLSADQVDLIAGGLVLGVL